MYVSLILRLFYLVGIRFIIQGTFQFRNLLSTQFIRSGSHLRFGCFVKKNKLLVLGEKIKNSLTITVLKPLFRQIQSHLRRHIPLLRNT